MEMFYFDYSVFTGQVVILSLLLIDMTGSFRFHFSVDRCLRTLSRNVMPKIGPHSHPQAYCTVLQSSFHVESYWTPTLVRCNLLFLVVL